MDHYDTRGYPDPSRGYGSSSPPYRQPQPRGHFQYPPGTDQYGGPPSDISDRRDYRDLPEYGRNGYRGNGSLPRDQSTSAQYRPPIGRPSSALPDQFHPGYTRGPPQQYPHYSNGSYNGPPTVMMESPPRPGVNRTTAAAPRSDADDKDKFYQQTMTANQQYERVS